MPPDVLPPGFFERLVAASPCPVCVVDLEGLISFATPPLVQLLGAEGAAALEGEPIARFIAPDAWAVLQPRLKRLSAEAPRMEPTPTSLRRLDGALCPVEACGAWIDGDGWGAIHLVLRDTSRARTREAQLSALIESSPQPTLVVNTRFEIEHMNAQFTGLFGYTLREVADVHDWWPRAYPDEDYRAEVQEAWWARVAEMEAEGRDVMRPMSAWVTGLEGQRRFIELSMSRVEERYLLIFQDLTARRASERRLEESEQRLSLILEGARLGTWDWDVPSGGLRLNPHWAAMLGEDHRALTPHFVTFEERLHPEDRAATMRAVERHFQGEDHIYSAEFRMRHARGAWVWVQTIGRVVERTPTGYPRRVVGVHINIDARKRAERQLEEQSAFYRGLYEHVHDGIIMQDRTGRILSCNKAVERILGLSQEAILGCDGAVPPWSLFDEAGRPLPMDMYPGRSALKGGRPVHDITLGVQTEGLEALRWIEVSAVPLRSPSSGEALGVVSSFSDITQRREALLALKESEQRLADAIDAANLGTWEWDLQRGEGHYSARWLADSGADEAPPSADLAGWFYRIHPEDRDRVLATLKGHIKGERPYYESEHRLKGRDGRWLWILDRGRVVAWDRQGQPQRLAGAFLDLSQQKAAEQARAEAEKRVSELQKLESLAVLAGGVAHDFNNLLVGVLGNAELAQMELEPDHPAAALLDEILQAAQQATNLAKQMLAYSGRGKFKIKACDLSAYAREMLTVLRASIPPSVRLSSDLPEPLPIVEADDTQLRQVMMNLIINAAESIGEAPGEVWISTGHGVYTARELRGGFININEEAEGGRYAFFEVRDTGCGFDEETAKRLFEPFFTTKFTGRGLGLSAVLGVIRAHKGALHVTSEPGAGSVFRVYLPIAEAEEEEVLHRRSSVPPAQLSMFEGRALIVDDEAPVRSVTARMLRHLGFEVHLAADGVDALSVARKLGAFEVVLLDMTMPRMNGAQALAALQEQGSATRFILMSGYNEQDVMALLREGPELRFLQKPFSIERLSNKLLDLLS